MWDREADLRADYEALGRKLKRAQGAQAAAIVRERRVVGAELERLSVNEEASLVDQLAARRAEGGVGRSPARRRQSG